MKIACASDLHGTLPEMPDADLYILAGDYCPVRRKDQRWWFRDAFMPWLEKLSKRAPVVGVAGNHDYYFEDTPDYYKLPWTYLQDSGAEVLGLKIWGSPWQLRFYDWAFNLDEPELTKKYEAIPHDVDILVSHGPPFGAGDSISPRQARQNRPLGSPSLRRWIVDAKPRLVVCGHIHGGYGVYEVGRTTVVNAAHMDEQYRPVNPVQVVEVMNEDEAWAELGREALVSWAKENEY